MALCNVSLLFQLHKMAVNNSFILYLCPGVEECDRHMDFTLIGGWTGVPECCMTVCLFALDCKINNTK